MSYSQQDSFFMPLIVISIQLYLSFKNFLNSFFLPFLQRIIIPWNKKLFCVYLECDWGKKCDLGFYLEVQILGDYFNLRMFSLDSCFNFFLHFIFCASQISTRDNIWYETTKSNTHILLFYPIVFVALAPLILVVHKFPIYLTWVIVFRHALEACWWQEKNEMSWEHVQHGRLS